MSIYYVFLILIICLTVFFSCFNSTSIRIDSYVIGKRRIQRIAVLLIMMTLSVITGIRNSWVGSDTGLYVKRFQTIGETSWAGLKALADSYSFEYGFTFICKILYCISSDYRFFLMIPAVWSLIWFYVVIKRYSSFPMLSLLVFYCWGLWGSSMSIIRQMMVMPVLFLAIDEARKKNLIKYILIVLFAATIHEAAVAFLLLYPIIHMRITIKKMIAIGLSALFLGTWGYRLLGVALSVTSFGWYFQKAPSTSGFSTLLLISFLIVLTFCLREQLISIDKYIDIWMMCMMIALFSTVVGMHVGIFERLTRMFVTSFMFVYVDLYQYCKRTGVGVIALPALIGLLSFYFLGIIMKNPASSSYIIPYSTWLVP